MYRRNYPTALINIFAQIHYGRNTLFLRIGILPRSSAVLAYERNSLDYLFSAIVRHCRQRALDLLKYIPYAYHVAGIIFGSRTKLDLSYHAVYKARKRLFVRREFIFKSDEPEHGRVFSACNACVLLKLRVTVAKLEVCSPVGKRQNIMHGKFAAAV